MHIKEGITYHQRKEGVFIDSETGAIGREIKELNLETHGKNQKNRVTQHQVPGDKRTFKAQN